MGVVADNTLSINSRMTVRRQLAGVEQTPILIIDDLLNSSQFLSRLAAMLPSFSTDEQNSSYPGVRAPLPAVYVKLVLDLMQDLLPRHFDTPSDRPLSCRRALFSLLGTAPQALGLMQRLPHFDSTSSHYFAVVHYLHEGEHGGTGFFRHRRSGYENITEDRREAYVADLQRHFNDCGEPQARYIDGDTELFELIKAIDYRPNRLLVYPGRLLHSGLIKPELDVNTNPQQGRLTANFFLEYSQ